jgi:hypothetical protein
MNNSPGILKKAPSLSLYTSGHSLLEGHVTESKSTSQQDTVIASKMLKPIYQTTQSHIPQQYNINIQENTNKCTILYIKASFTIKELEL